MEFNTIIESLDCFPEGVPEDPFKEGKKIFTEMLPRIAKYIEAESTVSMSLKKLVEVQTNEKSVYIDG